MPGSVHSVSASNPAAAETHRTTSATKDEGQHLPDHRLCGFPGNAGSFGEEEEIAAPQMDLLAVHGQGEFLFVLRHKDINRQQIIGRGQHIDAALRAGLDEGEIFRCISELPVRKQNLSLIYTFQQTANVVRSSSTTSCSVASLAYLLHHTHDLQQNSTRTVTG